MKRKLSVIVLAVMLVAACFAAFAACDGSAQETALKALLGEVDKQFAAADGKTSYKLVTTLNYKGEGSDFTCFVKWEADNGVVIGTDGAVAVPAGVTSYTLKAALVDKDGNQYKVEGNPIEKKISVNGEQGGNDVTVEGSVTAAQVKAEAESLNLTNGQFSPNSYKVVAYAVKVTTKTLSGGTTVYDIDLADTANGEKQFALYHGNLSGNNVPAVGDKVLVVGFITRHDFSADNFVLQLGGKGTAEIPYATVEVLVKGSGTTQPDTGNQGGSTGDNMGSQGGTAVTNPDGSITFDMTKRSSEGGMDFTDITHNGVTISASKQDGQSAPKFYPDIARLYAKNTLTVSADKTIKSITFTFENYKDGVFYMDSATVTSGTAVNVNGASATFTVSDKGQIRISQIVIVFA